MSAWVSMSSAIVLPSTVTNSTSLQHFRWRFPSAFSPVEVTIEAHDGQGVFLCNGVLVGIIKVQVESPSCMNEILHVLQSKPH
jgi:hypothetical protein